MSRVGEEEEEEKEVGREKKIGGFYGKCRTISIFI
jgi:hypothetical protein